MGQKRILWVRLDAIGDNLLASSMLPHIYEKYEKPQITVVCQKHIAELYEANPFVARVIGVEKMRLFLDPVYRGSVLQGLRDSHFDVALDSSSSWEQLADLFVVGSLAKEKIAFGNSNAIPGNVAKKRGGVYTSLIRFRDMYEPEMERHRDFLRGIGVQAPPLKAAVWTTKEDDEFADQVFEANRLAPEKTLGLFAFGRSHLRTYPLYSEALSEICKENDFSVMAIGDGAAYGFNQVCLNELGVHSVNLSGKTTLRQTAALLKRCRLAVGAETGTAHMACAVDTPNVVVMGGGHFWRFMPYSVRTSLVALPIDCYFCDWLCKHEYSHCVIDLDPGVLEFAVRETLRTESEKPRLFLQPADWWKTPPGGPRWKYPDKINLENSVQVIPVAQTRKFEHRRLTKSDLEKTHSMFKPKELPQEVVDAASASKELRKAGKIEEALKRVEKAMEDNPGFPDLMNLKGEIEIELGQLDRARATLFGIITLFPFHTDTMNNIAVIEILQKRYDSAIGVLKRLLEVDPKNETALSNLLFIERELTAQKKPAVG